MEKAWGFRWGKNGGGVCVFTKTVRQQGGGGEVGVFLMAEKGVEYISSTF